MSIINRPHILEASAVHFPLVRSALVVEEVLELALILN